LLDLEHLVSVSQTKKKQKSTVLLQQPAIYSRLSVVV